MDIWKKKEKEAAGSRNRKDRSSKSIEASSATKANHEVSPEELLATGDPVDEARARIKELFTLEVNQKKEGEENWRKFEDTPYEDAVDKVVEKILAWKQSYEEQRWVEALLEHPGISVEDIITIWDRKNEL
ncbi:MAG TPA: hypothetical protein VE090_03290 [Methylomirabilota bacterium]|nr:hypothetical protein [Methylomirabilota bacterium]